MKKWLVASLVCLSSIGFVACNGDYDADPTANNSGTGNPIKPGGGGSGGGNPSVLTSGSWKITASSSIIEYPQPQGTQTVDIYAISQDCTNDNTYTFNSDKTVTTDEGPTKCNGSDPQTKTGGSWELYDNNNKLKVSDGVNTIDATVVSMNSNNFVLTYVTNVNNIKATTTTTYSRP